MNDIGLLERCDKCGGHLTLMESISNDDGSLWLVKRCLVCYGHGAEEVIQVSSEALRRQVEELQNDNAGMVKFLKDIMKYFDNPSKYGGTWPEFFSASIKQIIGNSHPGATLLKERDELQARCEELEVIRGDSVLVPTNKLNGLRARAELAEKIIRDTEALFDGLQTGCVNLGDIRYNLTEGIQLLSQTKKSGSVPKECYEEYGADLDGCSTQEREGCGSCHCFLSQAKEATNAKQIPE